MTEQKRKSDAPPPGSCQEKQRLLQEFLAASSVLMDLQKEQVQAIINHDSDFSRFDDLIHMARENKDRAKYAYIAHVETHHC